MDLQKAKDLKNNFLSYIEKYGDNLRAKFENIIGKASQHGVPEALWLNRTNIDDRVLVSWKTIYNNNITYEQLKSVKNGIVVEFVNDDYYNTNFENNETYRILKDKLGSDEQVSSIISIRKESGDSSSTFERSVLTNFFDKININYNNKTIRLNKDNYKDFAIHRKTFAKDKNDKSGIGNDKWTGFLFISIKGGQKNSIETHSEKDKDGKSKVIKEYLFNPFCEYANEAIKLDVFLVLAYYAIKSIKINKKNENYNKHLELTTQIENYLKERKYDFEKYKGDLLHFCKKHYSLKFKRKSLIDPILMKKIEINNFNIKNRDSYSVDLTHNEAVDFDRFYWDEENKCILSPTRPTNVFWSFHRANMMQQDLTLDEYFKDEKKHHRKRKVHEITNKLFRRNING